jgi:chromosome segregation ATPase
MSTERSGVPLIGALLVVGLVGVLVAVAAAYYLSAAGQLNTSRGTLATLGNDTAGKEAELVVVGNDQVEADEALASEETARDVAQRRRDSLAGIIERQEACVARQAGSLEELRSIIELQRANSKRTTTSAAWAKANTAAEKAYDRAIGYSRDSYREALAGRLSAANRALDASNRWITSGNRSVAKANAEIDKINRASKAINEASEAFEQRLDETRDVCGY